MKITGLFAKDINRNINGVIKVGQDDDSTIYQELDEYVVTREMEKHFRIFIDSYNESLSGSTDKIGVWISGFFGSGKSHFLKILSYLFENREIQSKKAIDFFKDKIDNSLLLADIERAVNTGTKDVILFNIDSKADANSRTHKDAIIEVMMKVFNDKLGYCGEIPWLAEFERNLDEKGQYDSFKELFHKNTKMEWIKEREKGLFIRDDIVKTLNDASIMTEESAEKWFDSAEGNYKISSEKFANIVKDYIERKGDHRVIFLVDEIGQYIGENSELMLNLQTVTEDLGKLIKGKAWIIVTSQEAIDLITTNLRGRDFSKIKGRFATNISLSGENTDAVIKKRILEKESAGAQHLDVFYKKYEPIMKNTINFASGTSAMRTYKGSEEFIDVYPFVPYQFTLVQKVFEQIRRVGAAGAHLSEGERSMLSAFQEAGKGIADNEVGKLVPFAFFYKSIETFLHGGIRRTINQAKDNTVLKEDDDDLLKVLFMIKYIKEVPSNLENITTLSVTQVDEDKISLRERIQKSLERLEKETLISKNGDEYEFLTDEEQDINKQVKDIAIDAQEITDYIAEVIFSEIYPNPKFKANPINQFQFNKIVDSRNMSSHEHDITLKIITPLNEEYQSEKQQIAFQHAGDIALIILPEEKDLVSNIKEELQTKKFLKRSSSLKNSETIQKIIDRKGLEVNKIRERIRSLIKMDIENASYFINATQESITAGESKDRINKLLEKLVKNVYSKNDYIKVHTPGRADIAGVLKATDVDHITLFEGDSNKAALEEIIRFVDTQMQRNLKVTLKTLKDKFMHKPYGWAEMDMSGLVACLFVSKRIRLQYNQDFLSISDSSVLDYLTRNTESENLVISSKSQADQGVIKNVKNIIMKSFGKSNLSNDDDELFEQVKEILTYEVGKLIEYKAKYEMRKYPGREVVLGCIELLETFTHVRDHQQLFQDLIDKENDLSKSLECVEPVKSFFINQVQIFDDGLEKLHVFEGDKAYYSQDVIAKIDQLKGILEADSPYSEIRALNMLIPEIEKEHNTVLDEKRKNALKSLDSIIKDVDQEIKNAKIEKASISAELDSLSLLKAQIEGARSITVISGIISTINDQEANILNAIASIIREKFVSDGNDGEKITTLIPFSVKEKVSWDKPIETEKDIEEYIGALRTALKQVIDEGNKIRMV